MIYDNAQTRERFFSEEGAALMAEVNTIMAELTESGELIGGDALADPSNTKTIRVQGGVPVVTDGPLAEAKEHFAGYLMVECETPSGRPRSRGAGPARGSRPLEVRPVMEPGRGDVSTDAGVEDLLRELAPQVLGALVRRYGQFDACEDAVQEALLAAAPQWPGEGVPGQPARLAAHGRRAAADRRVAQRDARGARARRRVAALAERAAPAPTRRPPDEDDTLTLLFLCCHPALSPPSQIALTLRAVGGLTTAQIAARVPGARGDDGAADQPRQAARSRRPARRSRCRRRPSAPSGCGSCCTCCT